MATITITISLDDDKAEALVALGEPALRECLPAYLCRYESAIRVSLSTLVPTVKLRFSDAAREKFVLLVEKAEKLKGASRLSLARSLASLERLAHEGYVEVYTDFADLSLGWAAYPSGDPEKHSLVGGLIFHCDRKYDDEGKPTLLDTGSWSVHT